MHGLETMIRLNAEFGSPDSPGAPLRNHPRIVALRRYVVLLPFDEGYRRWLYRSLNRYADQIVARPDYAKGEGWDDLEALQQITLSDMMEQQLSQLLVPTNVPRLSP